MAGSETSAAMLARGIVETLQNRGHLAFLVGGCVRDLLLGREPKDYDVATSARPEEILSLFPDARQVGAHFGVMLVVKDGAQVEVAIFRSDHAYFDGRRPFGSSLRTDRIATSCGAISPSMRCFSTLAPGKFRITQGAWRLGGSSNPGHW